ncbi:MAG: hypothetical protein F6K56_15870 [Moorea sp. SIO3G5]|nr:hypothetical protein [Moorena sp. SIO3G5]
MPSVPLEIKEVQKIFPNHKQFIDEDFEQKCVALLFNNWVTLFPKKDSSQVSPTDFKVLPLPNLNKK